MAFSVTYNKVQEQNLKHIHVNTPTRKKPWFNKFKFFKHEKPENHLRYKGLKVFKDIFGRKKFIGRESEFEYSRTYSEFLPRAPALKSASKSSIAETVYRLTLPAPRRDPPERLTLSTSHPGGFSQGHNDTRRRDGLNSQNKVLTKLEMNVMVYRLAQPAARNGLHRCEGIRKHRLTINSRGDPDGNLAPVSV